MNDLISIIVPIYNVAEYLPQSLDSIINQTYTKLQVILVDDASTDGSSSICDEYARKDTRITVVHHKLRGGVSATRNDGLKAVKGNYIGFIDPDDYADERMVQKLYENICVYHADVAVCNYRMFGLETEHEGKTPTKLFDSSQALQMLIEDTELTSYLWNKLFKVELFDGLWFDTSYRYEDLRIMHKIFMKTATIIASNEVLYHYRLRRGSITNSTILNKSMELIDALEARCNDLKDTKFYMMARINEMIQIRRILLEILSNNEDKKVLYLQQKKRLKSLYSICRKQISFSQKIKFQLFFLFPTIYARLLYSGRK